MSCKKSIDHGVHGVHGEVQKHRQNVLLQVWSSPVLPVYPVVKKSFFP
jgi:hypothetical protein